MVFANELHTVHALLYRPQREVDDDVLERILTTLATALTELENLFTRAPLEAAGDVPRSTLGAIVSLAGEICSDCVPHRPAPQLRRWMDRVQSTAGKLAELMRDPH